MTDTRTYHYVGPKDIREQVADAPRGHELRRPADVLDWMATTHQTLGADRQTIATFTLGVDLVLRCDERNVVREGWFECAMCGAALPERWNFEKPR